MKKMTGYEYTQFINADWDKFLGITNAYMDAQEITVNGVNEWDYKEDIANDARVVISGGCVLADEPLDLSLETLYTRWKKAQTSTVFVVEVPNTELVYFKEQVNLCRSKVIK